MTGTYSKSKKFLSVLLLVTFMLTTVIAAPVFAKVGTDIKVQIQQMVTDLSDVASVDVELTSGAYNETVSLTMDGNQAVGHVDEDLSGQNVTVKVTIHWINGTSISITYHTSAANAMLVIQPDGDKVSMIEEGSITITKTIDGDIPAEDATFSFTVEGYGTVTITGEGSTTIPHVAPGTYTVTEIDLPDNYSIGDYDMDVTVIDQQIAIAAFTNTYTEPEVTTYTVTYEPGTHGTFTAQSTPGLAMGDPTPTAPAVTGETNYTFTGWSPAPTEYVEGNATYVAQWQYNEGPTYYTVTYDPGTHGTFEPVVHSSLIFGADTPDAPATPGDEGWTFTGWSPARTETVEGTVTYVAQWESVSPTYYTVTYAPGTHGTFDPVVYTELEADDPTPDAPTTPGDAGWTFSGWSPARTATVEGTVTYVAQWEPIPPTTYTVSYEPGTHGTFTTQTTGGLILGADTPDAPATPGDEGWTFTGWSPTPTTTVEGNATYVAQWDAIPPTTYTVSYEPGAHGTFTTQSTSGLLLGADTPAAPATPGDEGWTFLGWSPARSETVTGNATYIAQWQSNQVPTYYTVTYAPGEHGDFDPVIFSGLPYGVDTPDAPEVPDGFVYLFNGWSPAIADTVTGDATYTAQWKRKSTGGSSYYEDPVPEVIIEETPAPEAPIVITPAPEEVPEEIIIVDEDKPLGELPKTGTGPMCPASSQAAAYLPEELVLNFKDEDEDEIA